MNESPALRRAALARLERGMDPRATDVLRRSLVEVREREGAGWESSAGTVRAVDVRVLVDGHALGVCDASPSVADAVTAAIAAEAPAVIGASVVELEIAWGVVEARAGTPYRDESLPVRADPGAQDDVRRAVAAYAAAAATSEAVARARIRSR